MGKLVVLLAGLLLAGSAFAQTYKCLDAKGKVTYTSIKCSELRLKDGGEVKERVQSSPGDRAAAEAARHPPKPAPVAAPAAAPEPAAKTEEPERRCFKTAGGMRCGDKQE